MELTLSNPLGLLALLGVPLVIAFHFLQRKRLRFLTSTIFLVPQRQLQEKKGTRFQFWRNSLTFWLQILAVLLVAWLMAKPRWVASDWRQQVILIHDASISMRAFNEERMAAVDELIDASSKLTRRTEWVFLPTDARSGLVYRGMDADAFRLAVRDFLSSSGQHSFEQSYQLAEELSPDGKARIVLLSDHVPSSLPPGIECLAVGSPIANIGFCGLAFDGLGEGGRWRASVRNYGTDSSEVLWQMKQGGALLYQSTLTIAARSTEVITSTFPEDAEGPIELILEEDDFGADNRISFYRPEPKRLDYAISGADAFVQKMSGPLSILPVAGARSDVAEAHLACVEIEADGAVNYQSPAPYGVEFRSGVAESPARQGFYAAERHALMQGLNWNALRYVPTKRAYDPRLSDTVLLWHGSVPLIVLREDRDLVFNFSPKQANALRLPAFLVLVNRFMERCAARLPLPSVQNFEGQQSLGFEFLDLSEEDVLECWIGDAVEPRQVKRGQVVRAPVQGTDIRASLNGETFLVGAVYFAETGEADFSEAEALNQLELVDRQLIENNSQEDFLATFWLLLLGVVLLLGWHTVSRGI